MSNFNKNEYNKQYIKDKRKMYGWNMSLTEYDAFIAHCTNIGLDRSAYLKKLVNDDAIKRGMPLVFQGRILDGMDH